LNSYLWIDIDVGPDIPLLMHLSCLGDFVRADGGGFYYYVPPVHKSIEERALANNFRRLKSFPELRLAWVCAQSINSASNFLESRPIRKWQAFAIVFISRFWGRVKPRVFELTPAWIILIYRRVFRIKVSSKRLTN
jgi:hypothetical protein